MMFFHFTIGFVDVWVAGRLGRHVQACMGIINQALFFFLVVAIAFANGSVAAISQSVGAGLYRRVQRYVGLGLETGLGLGILFFLGGLAARPILFRILCIPDGMEDVAHYLFNVYLLILPAYYLFIITNAMFRARKQVRCPLYAIALVSTVNSLGDLGFGLGYFGFPNLGYKGLAWATFVAISTGTLFNLVVLAKTKALARKSFAPWKWVRRALPYLFSVAWPAGLMQLVWHSAYLLLFSITASLPTGRVIALAGMSAGLRVESLFFLPGFAFNFTAAILVGHYLGAGDPKEAKTFGYRILGLAMVVVSLIAALAWAWIDDIARFVAPDPEVHAVAVSYLSYNLAALPFVVVSMVLGGALSGAGATFYQMGVIGSAAWLIRLPLAWLLGHRVFADAKGIWMAMFFSMLIQALAMLAVYQFAPWQRFALRSNDRRKPGEQA
ncbi:MAG: MATE family efflux transporter [Deltaproteobacteria bacterium]|nr:MAG: MATE family efflux transporter [Deltaproteobacteria bacterium]